MTVSSASYDIDRPVPLPCGCGDGCCLDGGPQDFGSIASGIVRGGTGGLLLSATDIAKTGFGFGLGIERVYDNKSSDDVGFGRGWSVTQLPKIVVDGAVTSVEAGENHSYHFDEQSDGSFVPMYFGHKHLELDTGNSEYTCTDGKGSRMVFDSSDGKLTKYIDPYGNEAAVTYQTGTTKIQKVNFSEGGAGQSIELAFTYSKAAVQTIILKVDAVEARKATYGYSSGNLVSVTVEDKGDFFTGWQTVSQTYYRYDGSNLLEYVLNDTAYKQAASAGSGWPEGATGAQLDDYADYKFTYGGDNRVATVKTMGGKYLYSIAYFDSTFSDGGNNWKRKTVVTQPDTGITHTLYYNYVAQLMGRKVNEGSDNWYFYQKFDGNNRVLQQANSSAVQSFSDASAGLATLETSSGLIYEYGYNANGYLETEDLRQGSATGSGEVVAELRKTSYTSRTAFGVTNYFVSKKEVFKESDGTSPSTTDFAYTWHTNSSVDTFQIDKMTTTLPVVSTSENGDGETDTTEEHFNEYGFLVKTVDPKEVVMTLEYDGPTGAVIKSTADQGTDTSSHDYLNLETDYEVDNFGRVTRELGPAHTISLAETATEIRRASWTYYKDDVDQLWVVNGYIKTSDSSEHTINPVQIQKYDVDNGSGTRRDESISAKYSGSDIPSNSHSFAQTDYTRWSMSLYDKGGEMYTSRVYHAIPASGVGTDADYDLTDYSYDSMGRLDQTETADGTLNVTEFNPMNWVVKSKVGTATGNLVEVLENEYTGDAGEDGRVTKVIEKADSSTNRNRVNTYDWRNRLETVERAAGSQKLFAEQIYDNRNLITETKQYHTSVAAANLFAKSTQAFDNRGRPYEQKTYSVNSSGTPGSNPITSDTYYGKNGNAIRQTHANTPTGVTVSEYDAVNRQIQSATGYMDGTTVTDPGALTDVVVMEQGETVYDDASNSIEQISKQRFDDATDDLTGALGDFDTQPKARIYYSGTYPDALGRSQAAVNVGTNPNGSTGDPEEWSRPTTVPASDMGVTLVSTTTYNDDGEVEIVADPEGTETKIEYDDAGRKTKTIENYQAASSSGEPSDRVTRFEYNSDGNLKKLISENVDTGEQVTEWVYGVTTGGGSDLNSSLLVHKKKFPNSTTKEYTYEYNRLGQVIKMTDQNDTVHDYSFDGMGRSTKDEVTIPGGSAVDGAVQAIGITYNDRGLVDKVTSYDGAGTPAVVNEVGYSYNDFLQVTEDAQDHDSSVGSATPAVAYDYKNGSDNTIRREQVEYPGGEQVLLKYGGSTSANNKMSRLDEIKRIPSGGSEVAVSSYRYLGMGSVVGIEYATTTAVTFTYEEGSGGDAGDKYVGLDRFGREIRNKWLKGATPIQETEYGYSDASLREWRENVQATTSNNQDNYYNYNGLYEVSAWKQGVLARNSAGAPTGITSPTRECTYSCDETGNWKSFDDDGPTPALTQTRTANEANEITDIDNSTSADPVVPTYDKNGNTTKIPQCGDWFADDDLTWDAWNRLVECDDGTNTYTYAYDGLSRRITKDDGANTRHFYYNDNWQIVEEEESSTTKLVNFWGHRNLNDIVLRDRPNDEGKCYAITETVNVVAYVDEAGDVQKRMVYDAFGNVTFLSDTWGGASNSDEWTNLYHGHYKDEETGLYQMRFRYYHPDLGRWLSRDPIGERGGMNLYGFVGNDGVNQMDLLGLEPPGGPGDPETGSFHCECDRIEVIKKLREMAMKAAQKSAEDLKLVPRRIGKASTGREWGGRVCCNTKTKEVSATGPIDGGWVKDLLFWTHKGVDPRLAKPCSKLGDDWEDAGYYHSHPSGSPGFSKEDIKVLHQFETNLPFVLGTPTGIVNLVEASHLPFLKLKYGSATDVPTGVGWNVSGSGTLSPNQASIPSPK